MFWRKKKDLTEILLDRSVEYIKRSQAALDMSVLKNARFLDSLIEALKDDPEPSVRMNSCFAMGELKMRRSKKPLLRALKEDGSEWVRGFAASALANLDIDHDEIEAVLIEVLDSDRDEGARQHFAHSLGVLGSQTAGPVLTSILQNDLSAKVRADAAEALGLIGFQEGYDVIAGAAENDINGDVRRQSLIAKRKLDLDR